MCIPGHPWAPTGLNSCYPAQSSITSLGSLLAAPLSSSHVTKTKRKTEETPPKQNKQRTNKQRTPNQNSNPRAQRKCTHSYLPRPLRQLISQALKRAGKSSTKLISHFLFLSCERGQGTEGLMAHLTYQCRMRMNQAQSKGPVSALA